MPPDCPRAHLPDCSRCHRPLTQLGAISVSSPIEVPGWGVMHRKPHLCVSCEQAFLAWMDSYA